MSTSVQSIQGQSVDRTRDQILSELQETVKRLAVNVGEMNDLDSRRAAKKAEIKQDHKLVTKLTTELSRPPQQPPKKPRYSRSQARAA